MMSISQEGEGARCGVSAEGEVMAWTRRMTAEEHAQGWYVLACGEHAYVWRAAIIAALPVDAIER